MNKGRFFGSQFLVIAILSSAVFFVAPAVFAQILFKSATQPTTQTQTVTTGVVSPTLAPATKDQTTNVLSPTDSAVKPLAPPSLPAPVAPITPVKAVAPKSAPTNVSTGQFVGGVYAAADVQFLGSNLARMSGIAQEIGDDVSAIPVPVRVGNNTQVNVFATSDGIINFSVVSQEENLNVTWRIFDDTGSVLLQVAGVTFSLDVADRDLPSEAVVASIVAGQFTAPIFALPEIEEPEAELPPAEAPDIVIPEEEETLPEEEFIFPEEVPIEEEGGEAPIEEVPSEEFPPELIPEGEVPIEEPVEEVTFFEQFTDFDQFTETAGEVVEGFSETVFDAADAVLDFFGIAEELEGPTEEELAFSELPPLDIAVEEEYLSDEEFVEVSEEFAIAEAEAEEEAVAEEPTAEETIEAEIEFEEIVAEEELTVSPEVVGEPGIIEPVGDVIFDLFGPEAPEPEGAAVEEPTFFENVLDFFGFGGEEAPEEGVEVVEALPAEELAQEEPTEGVAEEAPLALAFVADSANPIPVEAVGNVLFLDVSAEEDINLFGSIDEAALILDRQGTVESIDGIVEDGRITFELADDMVRGLVDGAADASVRLTVVSGVGNITFIYYLGSVSAEEAAL